ncbi:hypothetical protein MIR68_007146 [Amoeboaphelidium protococcarum]|nr:hypothetical protein MIR68_007146 [Amoeboaphelidium protococcarum]
MKRKSGLSSSIIRRVIPLIEQYKSVSTGEDQVLWSDAQFMTDYLRESLSVSMSSSLTSADIGVIKRMKRAQLVNIVSDAIKLLKVSQQQAIEDSGNSDSETEHLNEACWDEPLYEMESEAQLQNGSSSQSAVATKSLNQQIVESYQKATSQSVVAVSGDQAQSVPVIVENTQQRVRKKIKIQSDKSSADKQDTIPVLDPPADRYSDMGGIRHIIQQIRELIEAPLLHPEVYRHLNVEFPRGILLHGVGGVGKTKLAYAIAGESGLPFIQINAPSIVSGMSGESEKKIRDIFHHAKSIAPCLIFIDEIDAITPKRENAQREMERRIVAQLISCMDELYQEELSDKPVIVIGATNRVESLDPSLRRNGRFDREICIGVPDKDARREILEIMCSRLRLGSEVDLNWLALNTPGYVGADLKSLCTAAGMNAAKRIYIRLGSTNNPEKSGDDMQTDHHTQLQMQFHNPDIDTQHLYKFLTENREQLQQDVLETLYIEMNDFQQALKTVQPSSKREGFATVPDVTWGDIGALSHVRQELRLSVIEPIKHPELFKRVGIKRSGGVLLYGCPGNGKTLLAKAVANESHCNFISVKGPELLNKYVGESEKGIRQVFARARQSSPCIIFFDELDALCPRRGTGSDSQTSERIVNQLLTEMDGLEERKDVYIIAASNRPDILDRAILRPGRFDKLLYVGLPSVDERADILRTLSKSIPFHDDVDLKAIAAMKECDRFSGADLSALLREAGFNALKKALTMFDNGHSTVDKELSSSITVCMQDFVRAFQSVRPSVSVKDLENYERIHQQLSK